jgi:branched-chain amino acid transport system ATP-binding protein
MTAVATRNGPLLEATDLGARYGSSRVLWDINLHVSPGEIVTLLGANGAGKTTFLTTVMGLVQMTSGRIVYDGNDISRRSPEARVGSGIALCPEGRRIFAKMTVEENLRLGAGLAHQQLAVGRALMGRPKLLLLDEPSLGLAPRIVRLIFELIQRLRDDGVTVLLVEQNVRMALLIADRGYVINTGRIELSGTADELRESAEVEKAYLGLAAHA